MSSTFPYHSLHFIGVLTPEMASLAVYAARQGCKVSASDDHEDTLYQPMLQAEGVVFFDMFAQTNVGKQVEAVVLSPYYDAKHIEAESAQRNSIPLITSSHLQKELAASYRRCALLSDYDNKLLATWLDHVWHEGHIPVRSLTKTVTSNQKESLATVREADWMILPLSGFKRDALTYEADFLSYDAELIFLPSIRYDYPEINTTLDDVYQSYYTFVKRIPRKGLIIGNGDYSRMKRLRAHLVDRHIETYGLDRDAAWHIREVSTTENETTFSLAHTKQLYGPFVFPARGVTFLYAAAAVAVASLLMDMPPATVGRGLKTVPLPKRYLSSARDREGRTIIDDHADHPETIRTVLETVRELYPEKKIWCLYQPGSFLRMKALFQELEQSLAIADFVYIADILGYPKEKSEGLNVRHFIAAMKKNHQQTYYIDETMDMTGLLRDRVATTDCIVTVGVDGLCQRIVAPLLPGEETET